jgi:pheromone a factor receptor
MALASVEMLLVFPMSVVVLVYNASLPLNPWLSWDDTHYNFGHISYYSNFILRTQKYGFTLLVLTKWCMPLSGLLFFIFFGMASETRKQYKQAYYAVLRMTGIRPAMLQFSDRKDTPYVSAQPTAESY